MAIFKRRRREPVTEQRGVTWPGYPYGPGGSPSLMSAAGVPVTMQSAMQSMAVWACQRVMAATVSKLPIDVIRVQGKRKTVVNPQPLVVRNPSGNPSIRRRAWVGQCVRSSMMCGNIYADALGFDYQLRPTQVEILDPARVTWQMTSEGVLPHVDGVKRHVWPQGDLWHVPSAQFMAPGQSWALSPTDAGRTAIGTGIAAEEFGSRFFADGAHPTAIFKGPPELTAEQAEAVKTKILAILNGSREPLVMGDGWEMQPWVVDPKDSQFLDLLRFEVEQACRLYGVPPSMVYSSISGQAITYQNLSDADLMFLKYGVEAWIVDLEEAWSELIVAPQVVKFDTDAILRMDPARAWDLGIKRLEAKTVSVNELRIGNDEEPFPDPEFDKPGIPGGIEAPAKPVHVAPAAADAGGTAS